MSPRAGMRGAFPAGGDAVSGTVAGEAEEAFRSVGDQVVFIFRLSPRLAAFSPADLLSVAPVHRGPESL